MPKVLPEYLELRRQQILDASAACFARRGFHQTTMQDICLQSDLSPGAVYRYFRSKEEIIEAMCAHGQRQNAEVIEGVRAQRSTADAFDELIRIFFLELGDLRSFETCALNLELISEAPRNLHIREYLTETNREVREQFVGLIQQAQSGGEIDPSLDAVSVARVMIAVYQGFITQRLVEPEIDVEGYAQVLRGLFGGTFWQGATEPHNSNEQAALRH
ncbi:MAG TPA: TetR/AcrR family transcriptional regulator [Dehalococcoidia bacterium]|nr:TetR/AcrR family transcriptional regulator [Dehalococcoidia bacterium]